MTFLGLRPSKAGGWVHDVRWTDSFKAFADQRMMIADLANIDRADHNAMHSPNARTRHHVQPGFAKEPTKNRFMFSPQSTLGRLIVQNSNESWEVDDCN